MLVAVLLGAGCGPARGTIGAKLGRTEDGQVVAREIPPGLGAAKAGLKEGDVVLLIDGQDVRELSAERLHRVLSGQEGSQVRLTVERGREVLQLTVVRTPVPKRSSAE